MFAVFSRMRRIVVAGVGGMAIVDGRGHSPGFGRRVPRVANVPGQLFSGTVIAALVYPGLDSLKVHRRLIIGDGRAAGHIVDLGLLDAGQSQ